MLRCEECGEIDARGVAWRALLTEPDDDLGVDVVLYCPDCAGREFGQAGRRRQAADEGS